MFWLFICGGGGGGQLGGGVGVENTPQVGGGVGVEPRLSPKAKLSSDDKSEEAKSSLLNLPLSWTMVVEGLREDRVISELQTKIITSQ